ncbi:MAG: TonB-dependent receptor [Bacteroidetes bacterium]|nr:TonB-dependent receptor [Bacteroidota bacterium]
MGLSAESDSNGYYRISNIKPGSYTVKASGLGFADKFEYNVIVTSGNTNNVNFMLSAESKELKGATFKGKSFKKVIETPLSINSLGAQEIKSFPGANFDIVKVAQSLPGVSGSVGFRNDLIIRGGAPNENVYYLDGIEVPNINHFATQGSAGGPVGMLNVAFIDEVTLSSSAFNSKYDNPLSGVLQFRQKTGNPDRVQGNFRLGASEAALTLEGPLSKDKRWTYIASVRRSYLQFLFQLIDLPFLPNYWDYQYKVTFKPNKRNEISLIGLNAIDDFTFNPPKIDTTKDSDLDIQNKLYILNSVPKFTQYSAVAGVNWKRLINKGFMNLSISSNVLRNRIEKYDDNDMNNAAKLRQKINSYEWEHKLRFEVNKYQGTWKYSYGANIIYSNFKNDFFSKIYIQPLNLDKIVTFNTNLAFLKMGAFGNVSKSFFNNRMNTSFGIRTDMNTFTKDGMNPLATLSPRFNISYALRSNFNLNASIGKYFKIAPYTLLGYKDANGDYVNKNNKYISSLHITGGFEWLRTPSNRITIEGFYKIYNNYPVSLNERISLANLGGGFGFVGNEAVTGTGKGRTYGFEFCYQQKLTKHFYGILSYTYFVSEFTGLDGKYIPSAWDSRHLVTFTGGYKFKKNWEFGSRFRFLGAAPYTNFDTALSLNSYLSTGTGTLNYSSFNTQRFQPYFAIDMRLDKKFNFKKWSLDVFIDIQNVTGVNNPSQPSFTYRRDPSSPKDFIDKSGNRVSLQNVDPKNVQYIIIKSNNSTRTPALGIVVEF